MESCSGAMRDGSQARAESCLFLRSEGTWSCRGGTGRRGCSAGAAEPPRTDSLLSPPARGETPNAASLPGGGVGGGGDHSHPPKRAPFAFYRWGCSGADGSAPSASGAPGRQDGTYRGGEDGGAALPQRQDPLLKAMPLQSLGQRPQTSLYFGGRTRRAVVPPDRRPAGWKEPGGGIDTSCRQEMLGAATGPRAWKGAPKWEEGASHPRRAVSGMARACPASWLPTCR